MVSWISFQSYFWWFLAPSTILFLATVSIFQEVEWPISTISKILSKVFTVYEDFICLELQQTNLRIDFLYIYICLCRCQQLVALILFLSILLFFPFAFQGWGGPTRKGYPLTLYCYYIRDSVNNCVLQIVLEGLKGNVY